VYSGSFKPDTIRVNAVYGNNYSLFCDSYKTNTYTEQNAELLNLKMSRGSSVSIVTDCGLDDRGSTPGRGKGFFFQLLCPDQHWGPPSLLSSGYWGDFPHR
jgi:hypothetical protein